MLKIAEKHLERFWIKVNKNGPIIQEKLGPCWIWTSFVSNNGYGLFNYDYRQIVAHRFSYMVTYGVKIPKDILACHRCDNRTCVRPDHIFLGSPTDNMQDAVRKGRIARGKQTGVYTHPEKKRFGEVHGGSKVTEEQAKRIIELYKNEPRINGRRRYGFMDELKKEFNISGEQIYAIATGMNWKYLHAQYGEV